MKKLLIIWFILAVTVNIFSISTVSDREASFKIHQNMAEKSIFKNLEWKNVGPYFMGGRITDIEGYHNKPYKFLVAVASGSVWLTENNATTWKPLFDKESTYTIGDIAISQSNEDLIWVGTGEENSSRSSYAGTGIFKSVDGGNTWQNMGLADSHHIAEILIDPKDNNIVYVAVLGHLYTENEERGVFKTTNGGKTWQHVLKISARTGVVDLAMNPVNRNMIYAASWQRNRKAWNMTESGLESAIYKSVDSGQTWQKIVNGFPQNKYVGRIGIRPSRSKPEVLYAFLDNQEPKPKKKQKAKKSKSGITIELLSKISKDDFIKLDDKKLEIFFKEHNVPERFSVQMVKDMVGSGRFTLKMMVGFLRQARDPMFNTNIKGAEVYRSDNGGKNWYKTHKSFLDNSIYFSYGYYFGQIRISPVDENTIYILGVPLMKSTDGGKTFKDISTQGGIYGNNGVHADMQALWIDPDDADRLLLGNDGGINISYDEGDTWQKINNLPIAQCYSLNYDMEKPYNLYTGLQDNGVNIGPSNFNYGDRENIWRMILGGDGAFVQPEPNNPNTVYAEFQFGAISRIDIKKGDYKNIKPPAKDKKKPYRFNWLSPFMVSRHNPYTIYMGANKLLKSVNRGDMWIEVSADLTDKKNIKGDVPYATITAIDESHFTPQLIYAGTDDGNVWVSKDGASNWQNISSGLPKKWVTRICASKHEKSQVYVSLTGYREDDFKTYIFASQDMGKTWQSIKSNLPNEPVNVIREDTENKDILYLGTDMTIYISLDQGKTWHSLKNNLPSNAVYDLKIHPREKDLIIATHGRGVYILPIKNITLLKSDILKLPLYMFDPDPVILAAGYWYTPKVEIQFYSNQKRNLTLAIKEKSGKKIKSLKIEADHGINIYEWDLFINKKKKLRVKKGNYKIMITSKGIKAEGKLIIK